MFGNPTAERAAIETLYEDTATISRMEDKQVGNLTKKEPVEVYTDILCGLSQGGNSSTQTEAQQNVEHDAVLFCAPELTIMPGDIVSVRRFGVMPVITFEVLGRPDIFATHQEVKLKDGDLA